jgi:hypothetical protein
VDVEIPGPAYNLIDDRPPGELGPSAAMGGAEQQLGGVLGLCEPDESGGEVSSGHFRVAPPAGEAGPGAAATAAGRCGLYAITAGAGGVVCRSGEGVSRDRAEPGQGPLIPTVIAHLALSSLVPRGT